MSRRLLIVVAPAVVAALVLLIIAGTWISRRANEMTVSARFTSTTGVYPGNKVEVLGVRVGTISKVQPEGTNVLVEMKVRKDVKIPADAHAVILQGSIVADRHVAFTPVYSGGPALEAGAVVPVERTKSPVEYDDLIGSLDKLFLAIGAEDQQRSIGELVKISAEHMQGTGPQLKKTITGLGQALSTLGNNEEALATIVTSSDALVKEFAQRDAVIRSFSGNVTDVAAQFAADSQEFDRMLGSLSQAMGLVGSFVRDNRALVKADVQNLVKIAEQMAQHRRELMETIDTFPLLMGNVARIRDPKDGMLRIYVDLGENLANSGGSQKYFCGSLAASICDTLRGIVPDQGDLERDLKNLLGGN